MINTLLKIIYNPRNLVVLLFILPIQSFPLHALPGDLPVAMIEALKNGNQAQLSTFFNSSIELAVPDKEAIYSKQQAELILKDFFTKYVPSDFVILHKGGKDGSEYAIGNLSTSRGNFRVTLLIKSSDNKPYIHQLRFEEQNGR